MNKTNINPLTGALYYDQPSRLNPTELSSNKLNPLYRPKSSNLPFFEKLTLLRSVGYECLTPPELETLLKK